MQNEIDWTGFTPDFAVAELPRLLEAAEAKVAALEAARPTTYEAVVPVLNEATRGLWRCWGMVSHLNAVMNSDAWRKVEADWQPKIVTFSLRVSQSQILTDILRNVSSDDPVRRRILDKTIEGAELAGVGLVGEKKTRFNEIQMRLSQLAMDFHNAVIDATTDEISDAVYPEKMKHCADRTERERLYRLRIARAPENRARIDEILSLRTEAARILGFETYAHQSLSTKCAPGVDAVLKMIDDLDAATEKPAAAEKAELEAFAAEAGLEDVLRPWDSAFYAERLRERKYAYSEEELKRHFELEDVLKGLFRMTKFLFGVEVVEVPAAEKPSVWHPDVRFFEVREGASDGRALPGKTLARFYFDPYVRTGLKSGGAWMNEFRNRRVEGGRVVEAPLAVLVTNFPLPDADGRCLLPFREVETIFHEFGHALQCMLTTVDEEDAAGISLVEWDAVEVASQFMENWCLDDRTGIVVPAELKAKVRAAKNFRAASACRRQLAFAKTDLELHLGAKDEALGVQRRNFAHFGLPSLPEDKFLCAFTHIFAGGYAAGYYGYKWAEVMSADCYGAFEEAGLSDDAAMRRLGKAFRETVLALGGSESARDVFRRFRGRAPEIGALLRQQGILEEEKGESA